MTINERIKYFRKQVKKMTQEDFSKEILLSRSNLAGIETGIVNVTDRVISTICGKFNLSESWLRTGIGNMYVETEADFVNSLADRYNMTAEQRRLMKIFLSMDEEKRDRVAKAFFDFVDAAKKADTYDIDQEVEAYRLELIAEKKAAFQSDDGSSSTKDA